MLIIIKASKMGGRPVHNFFRDNYIGIGEDHNGDYAFDFYDKNETDLLSKFLNNKDRVTIWYEGPNVSAKSKSYRNFISDIKKFIDKNKIKISIDERGWETDLKLPKDVDYTNILLGAEPEQYISLFGPQLTGKQTLAEAIVNSKNLKGAQSSTITMKELVDALSNNSKPSDILLEMQKENSATRETIYKIYGGAYNAMRAKYYEGTPGAYTSSKVYQRVQSVNTIRDKHLANKMKTIGGIFLAGDGHIEFVTRYI